MKTKLILLTLFYIPVSLVSLSSEEKIEILKTAALSAVEGGVPMVGSMLLFKRYDSLQNNHPLINTVAHVGIMYGAASYLRRYARCSRPTIAVLYASNALFGAFKLSDYLEV